MTWQNFQVWLLPTEAQRMDELMQDIASTRREALLMMTEYWVRRHAAPQKRPRARLNLRNILNGTYKS